MFIPIWEGEEMT